MPPSAHTLKLEAFAVSTPTQVGPTPTRSRSLTVTLTLPQVDPQLLTHRLDALSERLGAWYSAQAAEGGLTLTLHLTLTLTLTLTLNTA